MYSVFILIVIFLLAPLSLSAEEKKALTAHANANIQTNQKEIATSPVAMAAIKAGMTSCADRINQITGFLSADINSDAILYLPPADPDKRLGSVSLGLSLPDGKVAYASESFAPHQVNGCGGMYETVVYWDGLCVDVAKRQFPAFKQAAVLANTITVLDGGRSIKIFLMPAGTGCVAIKKEVVD